MFKEIYKERISQYGKDAHEYIVTDMLVDKLRGVGKSKQITALDMESRQPADFVPSMFYIFAYKASEEIMEKEKFFDVAPLFWCMKVTDKNVTGTNFNFIPNDVRATLLDVLYYADKNFFEEGLDDIVLKGGTKFSPLPTVGAALMSERGPAGIIKIMETQSGVSIGKAVRTYDRKKVQNLRLIEFDVWKYIPFLTFKDAVRGANLMNIQASVIRDK